MAIENSFNYNYVKQENENYNAFDMSFSNKFTADLGTLYPISIQEMLPGDKTTIGVSHFIRTQPLVAPVMQDLYVETLSFAVPHRIASKYFREQISMGDGKILSVNQKDYTPPAFAYVDFSQLIYIVMMSSINNTTVDMLGYKVDTLNIIDCLDFHGIPIQNFFDKSQFIKGKKEYQNFLRSLNIPENYINSIRDYPYYLVPFSLVNGRAVPYLFNRTTENDPTKMSPFGLILYELCGVGSYRLLEKGIKLDPNASILPIKDLRTLLQETTSTTWSRPWIKLFGDLVSYTDVAMIDYSLELGADFFAETIIAASTTTPDQVNQKISLLPFQSTYKIYCEWFRDQQHIPANDDCFELTGNVNFVSTTGLRDKVIMLTLQQSAYPKDYFQAALPNPQALGEVFVPFTLQNQYNSNLYSYKADLLANEYSAYRMSDYGTKTLGTVKSPISEHIYKDTDRSNPSYQNTLTLTVNNIREAFSLQSYLETLNRAGTRYVETVYAMYGVTVPDAIVDRPLYLHHTSDVIKVSDVESNTNTLNNDNSINTPIGALGGKALSVSNGQTFTFDFYEFGYIITFMRIVPNTAYSQGLHRMFTRLDPLDFYNPKFANLGEQPTYQSEIFFAGAVNTGRVFGFMPRYSEYRANQDQIHGELNSSLDYWIATRKFNTPPVLGKQFLEVGKGDINNIFAVTDNRYDHFICDFYFKITKSSKMPIFDIPATLD